MHSKAEENYLKSLLKLSNISKDISTNDISKDLNIKMPTVTAMMKKFAEKGWVRYQSYKPIQLTTKGKKEAALIVRKHRLTEMFLVKVMNFSWNEVHEIAEQIEHIQSDAFFDKMDQMLNFPIKDPHGSPIPDKDGNIIKNNYIRLSECPEGATVILRSVQDTSEDFLVFLNELNLRLNDQLIVEKIHHFDNSRVVIHHHKSITFSEITSKMIWVEPIA